MDKRAQRNSKKQKKKKKNGYKIFALFVLYEFFFGIITAPFVLLYGPFQNAKSRFVGTAMGSMHYQWMATMFLSDEKIAEILGTESKNTDEEIDESAVNLSNKWDSTITYDILDNNSNFIGHVLTVSNPKRIHIGYTSKLNDENRVGETTSKIAMNNDAIAAINGGAFTDEVNTQEWTANGGTPSGVIITDGKVVYDDLNGSSTGMVAMTKSGRLIVGNYSVDELFEKNVTEAVSYQTQVLINNGKMTSIKGDGGEGSAPRTLIGQNKDGNIILAVLDAKHEGSRTAATIKEAQEVMYKLGCVTAGTLDGGKSATMYYNDEVVNKPSYAYGERSIPTAIIVK